MIYGLRVVAIGGGTGLAALLTGLKRFTQAPITAAGPHPRGSPSGDFAPAGGLRTPPAPGMKPAQQGGDTVYFADLAALVTVSDDGGSSGRLRDELQILPPGDIRNCLLALSSDESLLSSLFQHRFEGNGDLAGHNFGNLFLAALTSVTGDFYSAVRAASHVLAIEGRIFPSTTESVSLVAELEDGSLVEGETRISSSTQPIRRVSLDPPNCRPLEDSLTALREADLILLGPGSLYTSLIPNLLVPGVADAISDSKALVVYLCNIMTEPGETTRFGLEEHVEALLQHCPDLELSFVLANNAPVPEATLRRYRSEGADFVAIPESHGAVPCPVEAHDLLAVGEPVRHDGAKTAAALQTLFHRARLAASASS